MSTMRPLILATLAASLAAPALAEQKQTIYLNPHVGYQYFDDDRDLSESDVLGIGLEYRFLPHWAVEAVYSKADVDRKYVSGNSEFEEVRLDGTYYFAGPDERWNPYLSLGVGHADFDGNGSTLVTAGTNHEETRLNLGAGFRYNFTDSFSLRADLREFNGIDEDTFDTQASLGVSFAFSRSVSDSSPAPAPSAPLDTDNDGVPDNRDQCPGTPAGVSVDNNGCERDADRDGVADSRDRCPATPAGARVDNRGCELDDDKDGVVNSKDQCPGTAAGATVDATGCVGVTETVEVVKLNVTFPTNSSVIGDRFDSEIRQVAEFMDENPGFFVEIAGHSDSRGDTDYNRFLSERRANAVAERLTRALGVSADRVNAVGYGELEPVASNDTAAGRAENRRVEARFQTKR